MEFDALTGLDLQLLITAFLFLLFWTLHSHATRGAFFNWWMWGWAALGAFLLSIRLPMLTGWEGGLLQGTFALGAPLAVLQVPLFYLGARALRLRAPPSSRLVWGSVGVALLVGIAMGALLLGLADDPEAQRAYRGIARQLGLAVVFPYCAFAIYRYRVTAATEPSNRLVAGGFLAWGANQFVYGVGSIAAIAAVPTGLDDYILSNWALSVDTLSSMAIGAGAAFLILVEMGETRRSLRTSEDRFRHVVDNAGDAIFMHDADGRIMEVNRRACESLGYRREELLGMHVSEIAVEAPAREEEAGAAADGSGDDHTTLEGTHRRKDGTTFPVGVGVTRFTLGDEPVVLAVARDVTDKRRKEEELRRAKQGAESADRAKTEFLATMSHEIRTPMNAIIGMAELLEETDLTPEQSDYVHVFRTAGDTLLTLINEVLDLSKIEAGRMELDRRAFNPREVAEHVGQVFAVGAHKKGLEIAVHVTSDVPGSVVGDPDRLRQVLANLLGNAVKFTEEGEVVLEVRPGEEDREGGRQELVFSVRDTGPGISAGKLDSVFERFTQADSSVTRKYGGTGLGLTISRSLVTLMDGVIDAESEPGVGTRFYFNAWFETAPPRDGTEPAAPEDIRGLRALVVDDNPTNRLILTEMLSLWGLETREAQSGPEALERMREARVAGAPFHVLLLDGQMPGMSGFEVASVVRSDPGLADTTLMMLTSADTYPEDVARAQALGVAHYMVKPIRRARLLQSLQDALGAFRGRSAATEDVDGDAVASGRTLRILLAEDVPDNRMLIERYLAKTPHEVISVENGAEAVKSFTASPGGFDLVLMDVQMPVMDGYEATRRIRVWEEESGSPRVPILALTAHALVTEKEKSALAGCDAHLTKPITKKKLLGTVEQYASAEIGAPTGEV